MILGLGVSPHEAAGIHRTSRQHGAREAARGTRAETGKLPTIGFLDSTMPTIHGHWAAAFVQRLRELGWIEARSIAIEYRWAEGRTDRAAEIASEFVRLKVDAIVTWGYRTDMSSESDND